MIEAIFLALALAMDAFAVSLGQGTRFQSDQLSALKVSIAFGFAQSAMALAGWFLGSIALEWVAAFDHWIAFGLLAFIGTMMIRDDADGVPMALGGKLLVAAAIATSVDALAAGIALPTMELDPIFTIALIGVVTFLMSVLGVLLGRKTQAHFGRAAEVFGGIVLIAIGVKIVIEHTVLH